MKRRETFVSESVPAVVKGCSLPPPELHWEIILDTCYFDFLWKSTKRQRLQCKQFICISHQKTNECEESVEKTALVPHGGLHLPEKYYPHVYFQVDRASAQGTIPWPCQKFIDKYSPTSSFYPYTRYVHVLI